MCRDCQPNPPATKRRPSHLWPTIYGRHANFVLRVLQIMGPPLQTVFDCGGVATTKHLARGPGGNTRGGQQLASCMHHAAARVPGRPHTSLWCCNKRAHVPVGLGWVANPQNMFRVPSTSALAQLGSNVTLLQRRASGCFSQTWGQPPAIKGVAAATAAAPVAPGKTGLSCFCHSHTPVARHELGGGWCASTSICTSCWSTLIQS